ncbi:hypothetical protein M427DRAFT_32681 [Gonapodya prolifera JEL478]|uniref:C2H2-type domain-containing protein n=1 Tax=Gonapodya prolifera (strain JEL478) TaxID=1344416 RepID=A0A139AEU8_GONPJ|nr:hypothetical protein M427DRAFT_32681 [Gonapodya prolifera JEL478]|eukprot:KXS14955.1 hypothetical protein M427DRAFT_32681 [Gonapodya prolifera JEL478]
MYAFSNSSSSVNMMRAGPAALAHTGNSNTSFDESSYIRSFNCCGTSFDFHELVSHNQQHHPELLSNGSPSEVVLDQDTFDQLRLGMGGDGESMEMAAMKGDIDLYVADGAHDGAVDASDGAVEQLPRNPPLPVARKSSTQPSYTISPSALSSTDPLEDVFVSATQFPASLPHQPVSFQFAGMPATHPGGQPVGPDGTPLGFLPQYTSMPYVQQTAAYAVLDTTTGQITSIIPAHQGGAPALGFHQGPHGQVWQLPFGASVTMSEILPTPPRSPKPLPGGGSVQGAESPSGQVSSPTQSAKEGDGSPTVSQQILQVMQANAATSPPAAFPHISQELLSGTSSNPSYQSSPRNSPPRALARVASSSRPGTPSHLKRTLSPVVEQTKGQSTEEESKLGLQTMSAPPSSAPNERSGGEESKFSSVGEEAGLDEPPAKRSRSRAVSEEEEEEKDEEFDGGDGDSEEQESDEDDDYVGSGASSVRSRTRGPPSTSTRRPVVKVEEESPESVYMPDTNTSISAQYRLTKTGKVKSEKKKYICAVEGCGKVYRNLGGLKYHKVGHIARLRKVFCPKAS